MEKVQPAKKAEPEAVEKESVDAEAAAEVEDVDKSSEVEGTEATEAEDVENSNETINTEVDDAAPTPKLHVTCTVGVERQLQVLLPDR